MGGEMNAEEIVRILAEQYGIRGAAELDRRIREQEALDISIFRSIAKPANKKSSPKADLTEEKFTDSR